MVVKLNNRQRGHSSLTEVSRQDLLAKSRRGSKQRFKKRLNYQVSNFKGVDLKELFEKDYFIFSTPINQYTVTLAFPGVLTQLKSVVKSTRGDATRVNLQMVIKALRQAFDKTDDVKVRCTCADFCLSQDTKIKLLDGRDLTVEELLNEFNSGRDDLWVYSVDEKTHDFRPGHISDIWIKGYVNELVEVEFDDGETVKCTPNHPFMLRDGSYKEAKDLVEGQSLMPLHFQCNKATNGYDTVKFNSKSHGYSSVYKEVAKYELQDKIKEARERSGEDIVVIHHKNFDKHDNRPENLSPMGENEYWRYRTEFISKRCKAVSSPEIYRQRHQNFARYWLNFREMIRDLRFGKYNRHVTKVTLISLDEPVPVYDLTVDKYNNFLVSSGVILHNCYRFMYWADKNGYLYGPLTPGTEEFPKKTNPNDSLGATCKHLNLFLSNKRWLTKAASVVNSLIKTYPEKASVYLYDQEEIKEPEEDEIEAPEKEEVPNTETETDEIDINNDEESQDSSVEVK